MWNLILREVNLKDVGERNEVCDFLEKFNLYLDIDVDYTIVLKDINGNMKATCSKVKNVFKCFAVSDDLRGENITSSLLSALIDKSFKEQIFHNFIFTKLENVDIFTSLNFKVVYEVENAALLEYGIYDINSFLNDFAKKYSVDCEASKGALVMNCNPFTNGHRFLIEEAAKQCEQVLVFIVEEDKSLFPFKNRYELVEDSVKDLKNVTVVPGGEYVISSATFPSYFLREKDKRLNAYVNMDCGIFGKYFCKKFNIAKRFVGQEPYSEVTRIYNEALKAIMPSYGVQLIEIERKKNDDEYISASKVRELIKENNLKQVKDIVPESTLKFLNTEEGRKVIEKIRKSKPLH